MLKEHLARIIARLGCHWQIRDQSVDYTSQRLAQVIPGVDVGLRLGAFFQEQASNYRHAREWVKDQEAILAPRLFNGCGKLESFLAAKRWDVSLPHT